MYVYQLIQVYNDSGDEFILGTYDTEFRAEQEKALEWGICKLDCEYFVRKHRVVKY